MKAKEGLIMNAQQLYQKHLAVLTEIIIKEKAKAKTKTKHFGVWAKRLLMDEIARCLVTYFRQIHCRFDREEIWLITRAVLAEITRLPNQAAQEAVTQIFWKYCLGLHFRSENFRRDLENGRWIKEENNWSDAQAIQYLETCWQIAYRQMGLKTPTLLMVEKAIIFKQGTRRRLQISLLLGEESRWLTMWLRLRGSRSKPYRIVKTPVEDYQK